MKRFLVHINFVTRFHETMLTPKASFYSELNLEDISDKDYLYAQKVWDVFEIRKLGEYHDLYMFSMIHYYLQMYSKNFEKNVLKYMKQILHISYLHQD